MKDITPRERFMAALERRPLVGRVPHFELDFCLSMEAFGRVHCSHRRYDNWGQMSSREKRLQFRDQATTVVLAAEHFEYSAVMLFAQPCSREGTLGLLDAFHELTGDRYFVALHGDATFALPNGDEMEVFSYRLVDDPGAVKSDAQRMVDAALLRAEQLKAHGGVDGFALCADYCMNDGPFLSPAQFAEFVAPYLKQLIAGYRSLGYYTIKHSDGNIMPIVDQLVDCSPHALHSLDPQGGVDLAEVKRVYGDRVCLIGNVNCGLLDTGTDEEVDADVRRALREGMPGYGYVFGTSNSIYAGMPLERYERMLAIWRREGNYPDEGDQANGLTNQHTART